MSSIEKLLVAFAFGNDPLMMRLLMIIARAMPFFERRGKRSACGWLLHPRLRRV